MQKNIMMIMLDAKTETYEAWLGIYKAACVLVLEVDIIQLLDDLAKNKDDKFHSIVKEVRNENSLK